MEQHHSLTFSTERGSLKIEIEQDLDSYKQLNVNTSDYYFFNRVKEIQNELIILNEQKHYNDIIWKVIRFKTHIGNSFYLYQREDKSYFVSLISPTEWKNSDYFNCHGKFILTTKNIWEKESLQ